jgi:transcriptional regulator with XRE-family HTH domain
MDISTIYADIVCGTPIRVQNNALGDKIKALRIERGLSLEAVERKANGIGRTHINNIENGQTAAEDVSIGRLEALARGLDVSVDHLILLALGRTEDANDFINRISGIAQSLSSQRQRELLLIADMFLKEDGGTSYVPVRSTPRGDMTDESKIKIKPNLRKVK